MFADAFWLHFSREGRGRFVRGPGFALGSITAMVGSPAADSPPSDPRQNLVVCHGFALTFALWWASPSPPSPSQHWPWPGGATVLVTLLWIETNAAFQSHLASNGARALGGFTSSLLLLFAFGYAVVWCSAEQRSRCPVCPGDQGTPLRRWAWRSPSVWRLGTAARAPGSGWTPRGRSVPVRRRCVFSKPGQ